MTGHPSGNDQWALQRAIEGAPIPAQTYGPGSYVYWALAHHLTASDVTFADLAPNRDGSTYLSRSGRLFVITSAVFVVAEYKNAAEESDGDPNQDFGALELVFHPREPGAVVALSWPARPLRIATDRFSNRPRGLKLQTGALTLKGRDWEIGLPGDTQDDGDAYVARLRNALGL